METDTLYTDIELVNATLEKDTGSNPGEPPAKAAFIMRMESPNLLEN